MCVCIIVHNCRTEHSTEQFWLSSLLSSRQALFGSDAVCWRGGWYIPVSVILYSPQWTLCCSRVQLHAALVDELHWLGLGVDSYRPIAPRFLTECESCAWQVSACYPHMPIGNVWIYRLLFVILFVFFVGTVADFSGQDKASAASNSARWLAG